MDFQVLARFGLLLIRPGMLVMVAPGLGGNHLSPQVKVGLTVLLALGLLPTVIVSQPPVNVPLTIVVARELAIGMSLAFVMRTLIAGAEFAGHLTGYQIGFSYGATIDPQSGVRNTMLATLYGSLATLGFFAVNGHHALIRALAASYVGLPIGAGQIDQSLIGAVRETLGLIFIVGAQLAAPVVIALLVVELAIGLISRTAPSLSFQVIGYPLRILVGLTLVAVLIPTIPAVTNSFMRTVLEIGARMATAFR
jgi:flagellar biosynthetic protein FliR